MFDLMVGISRILLTFIVGLLLGVPLLSVQAEAFDGEFILEAELSFFGEHRLMYVSPTGDRVCVATEDTIHIVDVETRAVLVERSPPGVISRGCWAGDLLYFVMYITDDFYMVTYIVVLDPEDLSEVTKYKPPRSSIYAMAASPTGDHFAFTARSSGRPDTPELYVIRTSDNEIEYSFEDSLSSLHGCLAWSPQGDRVVSVTDENIYIHDIEAGSNSMMDKRDGRTVDLVLTPDGTGLYLINREANIDLYDLVKREHVDTNTLTWNIECGDIDLERGLLCTGEWYDIRLYSLDTFEALEHHPDAGEDVTQVKWLDGGYRVVTISQDGFLRFYRDTTDPDWNTPPVITIISPTWGQEVLGDIIASGTVTDDGPSIDASYSLNEGPWMIIEDPEAWSFDILAGHMVQGSNQLTITASDGSSESIATVFFSFTGTPLPNARPTVDILSPADGSEVGEVMTITGTASDDVEVTAVLVQIGDGLWVMASGRVDWIHFITLSPEINGQFMVRAKAFDGILESQISEISLFLDRSIPPVNRPPRVQVELPMDGIEVTDTLLCRGTTEDEGMEPTTLVAIDGGAWTHLSTAPSWERVIPTGDWTEGPHTISFMAFDGELSSDVMKVTVMKVNHRIPEIHILKPVSGERFSKPLIISGTAIAGLGKIIRVEIRIDGGPWALAEGNETWSIDLEPDMFPLGLLTVEARAWDDRTNSTISAIEVVNEGDTPRGGGLDDWWVWLLVLVLMGVVATILWSRKRGRSGNGPKGPMVMVVLVMTLSLIVPLSSGAEGQSEDHEYDFQIVEEVPGIRSFSRWFLSPDHGNVCIINSTYEPKGRLVRVFNFTTGTFVLERDMPGYLVYSGCWVGDRIILSLFPEDDDEYIDPILVLSAHDLSTLSHEDPLDSDEIVIFRDFVVSPSGDAIAAYGRREVAIFDSSDFTLLHHIDNISWRVEDLSWSPDGKRISFVESSIWVYDLETKTSVETQRYYLGYERVMWSSNGDQLYVQQSGDAMVYDIATDEFIHEEYIGHDANCWAVNRLTNEFVVGDGTDLKVFSMEDLSFVISIPAAVESIDEVVWDTDGYRVIIMTDTGVMRIFHDSNHPKANQPPVIEILRPIIGEEVTGDITAKGSVTDDEQVVNARYNLNGEGWTNLFNPSQWSVDLLLADMVEGDNTLTVFASDGKQTTTRSVTFHVSPEALSNDPPTVTISTPREDDEVTVLVEVEGTAADDHGVTMVLVRMGEGRWTLAKGTTEWSVTLIVPSSILPGKVSIEARAWDDRLYSMIEVVNVTLVMDGPSPNNRPRVRIESPTEGEVVLGDVTVKGATDDDSDIVTTLMAIDGGPMETLSTAAAWERTMTRLGPGEHSVSVIASDGLLVSGVATVNFTLVDYEEMRVIISSPEDGAEVSEEVSVSGVVLGGFGELASVEVRLDGGEWTEIAPGRSWQTSLSLDTTGPMEHFIEVRAWDEVDVSNVANATVLWVSEEEGPQGPREPDNVYIWVILVIVIVSIVAVWRVKRSHSS